MNKILEAILRGILMGLEILDDELDLPVFLKSNVTSEQHVDRADLLRYVGDNFVDLGLPSGILWCKWNIGATNGDTPESWYGHYYMWGSTKPNENDKCCWRNVPFNNGKDKFDEKYFNEHMYEFVDEHGNLLLDYDVAHQTNHLMRMPSILQIQELINETVYDIVENYNGVNGLNGWLFTGKNGKTLFIPAAGWCDWSYSHFAGLYCYLWSSSLSHRYPDSALRLFSMVDPLKVATITIVTVVILFVA